MSGSVISKGSRRIRVDGHTGTWHVIDEGDFVLTPDERGRPLTICAHLFLLESE